MPIGYIKLHRKLLDWEWKTKPLTTALFLHILLKSSFEDNRWRGVLIKKGQLVTGRKKLSDDTGLSQQQVRTALNHLKSTNEITIKSTKEYSIITITNWDIYQSSNQQPTNNQPTDNQPITTTKEGKEGKKVKNSIGETPKTPVNLSRPESVDLQVWNDFKKNRKSKLTQTALDGIAREARKAGITLQDALTISCERGWQSFKSDWINKPQPQGENNGSTRRSRLQNETQQLLEQYGGSGTN